MRIRRGDVVYVYFPFSDLKQVKFRPALVVQADGLGTEFNKVIVAQITGKVERAKLPCRILVKKASPGFARTGLKQDSVIMGDLLATIERSLIRNKAGYYPDMASVDAALRVALSL